MCAMDINQDVYRTAKSTRPAWANALIVAGVLLLAAIVLTPMLGLTVAVWFYIATVAALIVAGIAALVGATRRVP